VVDDVGGVEVVVVVGAGKPPTRSSTQPSTTDSTAAVSSPCSIAFHSALRSKRELRSPRGRRVDGRFQRRLRVQFTSASFLPAALSLLDEQIDGDAGSPEMPS
jgi:hypothetical protein